MSVTRPTPSKFSASMRPPSIRSAFARAGELAASGPRIRQRAGPQLERRRHVHAPPSGSLERADRGLEAVERALDGRVIDVLSVAWAKPRWIWGDFECVMGLPITA
jgi:hypothetical protein